MKNKSIRALEKNRYSILTDNLDYCFVCGQPRDALHEVFEGASRVNSMKNGMVIPICYKHHSMIHKNRQFSLYYKILCQTKFEESHSREEFIKIFKRNYKD